MIEQFLGAMGDARSEFLPTKLLDKKKKRRKVMCYV